MAIPVKWGAEALANSTTAADQSQVEVTALDGGGFVMVWSDQSGSGADSDNSARGRIFDHFGNAIGDDFVLNTTTDGSQGLPDIIAFDGGFAATWQDGLTNNVVVQLFGPSGAKIGGEIQANANFASAGSAQIAALDTSGFVVTWVQTNPGDADGAAVFMRRFDEHGAAVGTPVQVNSIETGFQGNQAVTAIGDGRFVVVWQDHSDSVDDPSGGAVRMQLFNDDGSPHGGELLVNIETDGFQGAPTVVGLGNGKFIVAWSDGSGAFDGSDHGITGQMFDQDGAKIGSHFAINNIFGSPQGNPALAHLGGQSFIAGFVTGDSNAGYDPFDVAARIFTTDLASTPVADDVEFRVNTDDPLTDSTQGVPSLARLADGRILVAWQDDSQSGGDISGSAIRFQILDAREGQITGTEKGEALCGSDASAASPTDTMLGLGGNDFLFGFAGNDTLDGGGGNDLLDGGLGIDTMHGGKLHDVYVVNSSSDKAIEKVGEGTDLVTAISSFALGVNIENLTMIGGASSKGVGNALNNTIIGNAKINTLDGGAGNDVLKGMHGNDVLIGGAGKDVLTGGHHDDIFRFINKTHSAGATIDAITDFDKFGNDRIDVSALFGSKLSYIHDAVFSAAGQVRINDVAGADVVVEVNTGGSLAADFSLRLKVTALASMTASDFVL